MRDWSTSQLMARLVLLTGPLLALLPAPDAIPYVAWPCSALLGVAAARWPDGQAGLGAVALVVVVWALAPGDELPASVLLSAVVLVVFHVAGVLASYAPAQLPLGRDLLSQWALRTLGLCAVAGGVFALSRLLQGAGSPAIAWGAGVGAAVLLMVAGRVALVPTDTAA